MYVCMYLNFCECVIRTLIEHGIISKYFISMFTKDKRNSEQTSLKILSGKHSIEKQLSSYSSTLL